MQRKHEDGRRPRISVSVDPADYEWIQGFNGPSDSYTVSRILTAARLQGVTLDEMNTGGGGTLQEFSEWLSKKRKDKMAADLHALLEQFLNDK